VGSWQPRSWSGRWRRAWLAGLLVGLAVQAKLIAAGVFAFFPVLVIGAGWGARSLTWGVIRYVQQFCA
jgi:hypothetical protein